MKAIFKNLDIYITILICLSLSILGITGKVDDEIISASILAVLAILSYSLLSNRIENEDLKKNQSLLIDSTGIADKFLSHGFNKNEIIENVKGSNEVFLLGLNFTQTILYLKDEIEELLKRGGKIRIIIMKPNSAATSMAEFRNRRMKEPDVTSSIQNNIKILNILKKDIKNGEIELRVVNYLPPYTIYCFNPKNKYGKMLVLLTSFKFPNDKRPVFNLSNDMDNHWFNFFKNQFELLWKTGDKMV